MKKLTILALMAMMGMTAFAKTYYAGPNATGNGLTAATPGDFTKLVSTLKPGDMLYLNGGQYDFTSEVAISVSGTETGRITIQAANGQQPIFDFRKEEYGKRGVTIASNVKNLHVKGLTVRYAGAEGLYSEGSYCVFENMDVYGNCGSGFAIRGEQGHNLILNCDSHENFDYKFGGTTSAHYGEHADGFNEESVSAPGNYYRFCRAWKNSNDGWNFSKRTTTEGGNVLEGCIAFRNGPRVYDMRNHMRYETDKAWFDQFKGKGTTVTISGGNTEPVSLEFYSSFGTSNGVSLGNGENANNILVTRCLMAANSNKALNQLTNSGTMFIYNNTLCQNGYNLGINDKYNGIAYISNNVTFAGVSKDQIQCKQTTLRNNSWEISGVICDEEDFLSTDTAYVIVPRKADGTLAQSDFMRFRPESDVLDQGIKEVGVTYYGAAPDLGCFEVENGQMQEAVADTLVASVIGNVLEVRNALVPKVQAAKKPAPRGKGVPVRRPVARKK